MNLLDRKGGFGAAIRAGSVALVGLLASCPAYAQPAPEGRAELDVLRDRVARLESFVAEERRRRDEIRIFGLGPLFVFGLLQTRLTGVITQGGSDSAAPPLSFTLPRAQLGIHGELKAVSYVLAGELGQARGLHAGLADAYIRVRYPVDLDASRQFELRAGQLKLPLSHLTEVGEGERLFVDRPVSLDALGVDRDIGMSIGGFVRPQRERHWGVRATLGVWNGAGANRIDRRYGPLLLARIELGAGVFVSPHAPRVEGPVESRPLDVRLGLTAMRQRAPVPASGMASPAPVGRDSVGLVTFGADLTARFAGWALEAEGLFRRELWGAEGQGQSQMRALDEPFRGGVVELSYDLRWLRRDVIFPSSGLQLGLRTSAAEVSPIVTGGLLAPILGDVRTEVGAVARYQWDLQGFGLWLRGQYGFFNWARRDSGKPEGPREHRFTLELQIAYENG